MLKLTQIALTKHSSGFTLVEVAVVVCILGLVLGFGITSTMAYRQIEQQRTTVAKLTGVDAALVDFVTRNRRLPCPADGTLASAAANAGREQRDGAGNCLPGVVTNGVVPWITLGLTEADASDAWYNRITYRVPSGNPGFTQDLSVDMAGCDPAGTAAVTPGPPISCTACTLATLASCTSPANYLASRGLRIEDGAGVILMDPTQGTGAAYILISHGATGAGAYTSSGALLPGTVPPGTAETQNQNGRAIQTTYFDAPMLDATGVTHFDDIVSRPSFMSVISKAQLGPRAAQ
ncbi:MAG: hypothetical protein BWY57_02748 [Betaproteobacteria bacterium ADurb.Bin341]|nr:MAG: hypothetical protein BWY57_02748 [Betaproteobacteria bacterium ADurb.Bin341]